MLATTLLGSKQAGIITGGQTGYNYQFGAAVIGI